MSYHQVIVVGRLGRDPEMRYAPNGDAVTSLSVASDRQYTGTDGQRVKETSWFRVSIWGKQAESCNQYLKKGKMVLVEGRLIVDPKTGGPRIYTRSDGTMGASLEISATTVRFLSPKDGEPEEVAQQPAENTDDIPF